MSTAEDTTSQPTTQPLLTVEDAARSLTGFDEIAVERTFGRDIGELSATRVTRALVFVMQRRLGLDDTAAYNAAMGMSLADCEAQFAEPTPETPLTEAELLGEVDRRPEA